MSTTATTTFSLPATALSCVAETALTVMSPAMSSGEFVTSACARAGCSPLNAPEMSGSPSSVSMMLKKMFCDFQPIELNASSALLASQASMAVDAKASIWPVWAAETSRFPAWLVVIGLALTRASALLSTRLVTMTPPIPFQAETTLESEAVMVAEFSASTVTSPAASTTVWSIVAMVSPRTSLYAMSPNLLSEEPTSSFFIAVPISPTIA